VGRNCAGLHVSGQAKEAMEGEGPRRDRSKARAEGGREGAAQGRARAQGGDGAEGKEEAQMGEDGRDQGGGRGEGQGRADRRRARARRRREQGRSQEHRVLTGGTKRGAWGQRGGGGPHASQEARAWEKGSR